MVPAILKQVAARSRGDAMGVEIAIPIPCEGEFLCVGHTELEADVGEPRLRGVSRHDPTVGQVQPRQATIRSEPRDVPAKAASSVLRGVPALDPDDRADRPGLLNDYFRLGVERGEVALAGVVHKVWSAQLTRRGHFLRRVELPVAIHIEPDTIDDSARGQGNRRSQRPGSDRDRSIALVQNDWLPHLPSSCAPPEFYDKVCSLRTDAVLGHEAYPPPADAALPIPPRGHVHLGRHSPPLGVHDPDVSRVLQHALRDRYANEDGLPDCDRWVRVHDRDRDAADIIRRQVSLDLAEGPLDALHLPVPVAQNRRQSVSVTYRDVPHADVHSEAKHRVLVLHSLGESSPQRFCLEYLPISRKNQGQTGRPKLSRLRQPDRDVPRGRHIQRVVPLLVQPEPQNLPLRHHSAQPGHIFRLRFPTGNDGSIGSGPATAERGDV